VLCFVVIMHHSIVATFFVVAIAAASGQLDGQLDSQSALGGVIVTNEAFGGSAGTGNASIPAVTQITRALGSAAAVEAGTSTAPKPVQRAFLLSLTNGSDVGQKVRPISRKHHCQKIVQVQTFMSKRSFSCKWPDS
jgi:hypothetical protein